MCTFLPELWLECPGLGAGSGQEGRRQPDGALSGRAGSRVRPSRPHVPAAAAAARRRP